MDDGPSTVFQSCMNTVGGRGGALSSKQGKRGPGMKLDDRTLYFEIEWTFRVKFREEKADGWMMDALRFYDLFNSISVTS